MTKSDLIERLANRFASLAKDDAKVSVQVILVAMAGAMAAGRRCEIRGFGVFSVSTRSARKARNPKTGEPILVPAKCVPHFKPGRALAERVDSPVERRHA